MSTPSLNSTIKSFHHVAVKSVDYDKSFHFYTVGLGLKCVFEKGEGDRRMAFLELPDGSSIELFAGGTGAEPVGGWGHLAFLVDSADAAYDAAIQGGGTHRSGPNDGVLSGKPADMSIRTSFVYGPDKEIIEFFQLR